MLPAPGRGLGAPRFGDQGGRVSGRLWRGGAGRRWKGGRGACRGELLEHSFLTPSPRGNTYPLPGGPSVGKKVFFEAPGLWSALEIQRFQRHFLPWRNSPCSPGAFSSSWEAAYHTYDFVHFVDGPSSSFPSLVVDESGRHALSFQYKHFLNLILKVISFQSCTW